MKSEETKEVKKEVGKEVGGQKKVEGHEVSTGLLDFKIPFTVQDSKVLKEKARFLLKYVKPRVGSKLGQYLANCDVELTREEYLAVCLKKFVLNFVILAIFFTTLFYFLFMKYFYLYGIGLAFLLSGFVYFMELAYPTLYYSRKQRNIERNLIPALQDMYVQLSAGIPLFSIMTNISNSQYEELSIEFKKAIKKISAGMPQLKVLEELGERNASIYFRRALWQISNGMRAGSDIGMVIKESIHSLTEEQIIQIQTYGNKLNPMIMFYMLISVILPALAITFMTVVTSLINLSEKSAYLLFIVLYIFVGLLQVMFIGMIKSIRPSLL